jgi:arylsulfatase A-like enzyme
MPARPNILFITLDQFRGDTMSCAGHRLVKTPNLDRLANAGVRFARHYSQAAPCGPGRAALYTGTYQMNNRVVTNGTPLDDRFDNVARIARRAGYDPTLFGYTDQMIDPRTVSDPNDPRLQTYEGVLPGFTLGLDLTQEQHPWTQWLNSTFGHNLHSALEAWTTENQRAAEQSTSTFLTDQLLAWIDNQTEPWFAHASYLRPHPPYCAAGDYATMYRPSDCPTALPTLPETDRPRLYSALLRSEEMGAAKHHMTIEEIRAQYYGMISEVDANLGRLWDALERSGEWENTVIVVTADHGEQLGDQGLLGKGGFFESSFHILNIIRDPQRPAGHGRVIASFTENVDIVPTLCDAMRVDAPMQCDGLPLTPFLDGAQPPHWRDAAMYEWDWRAQFLNHRREWPWDQRLERQHLAVRRTDTHVYVQFGNGSALCYALADDPTWQTLETNTHVLLENAQSMLVWRSTHTDRTLTSEIAPR